jgi:pilus assembly protein FimV
MDLSPVSLDLEPATVSADEASAGGAGRWQEMATKLDLASAYEEIGDKEGARELLQEVIKGGDSGQQQKARAMLSKIG